MTVQDANKMGYVQFLSCVKVDRFENLKTSWLNLLETENKVSKTKLF